MLLNTYDPTIFTDHDNKVIDFLKGELQSKFSSMDFSIKKKDLYIWFGFIDREAYYSEDFQEFYHNLLEHYLLPNKIYNVVLATGD